MSLTSNLLFHVNYVHGITTGSLLLAFFGKRESKNDKPKENVNIVLVMQLSTGTHNQCFIHCSLLKVRLLFLEKEEDT